MPENIVIALDAMGGDHAPDIVIKGIDIVRIQFPQARFLLFGDEARLEPLLKTYPGVSAVCDLRHTDEAIRSEDKPSQALRKGRKSSMRLAIDGGDRPPGHCLRIAIPARGDGDVGPWCKCRMRC